MLLIPPSTLCPYVTGSQTSASIKTARKNYYNADFQGVGITQALTVYVYEDRIEFCMKNYDVNDGGSYEIEPYVVDIPVRPEPTPTKDPSVNPDSQGGNQGNNTQTPANQGQNTQTVTPPNGQNTPTQTADNTKVTLKKAAVSSFKVKKNGKNAVIKLKKLSGAEGYQIQIGTDKKFKKKAIFSKNVKKLQLKIKKLKKSKTYFVRARGYVTVNGKMQYGPWGSAKKAKM